ncbi:DUF305 domain-containing protein [uncultured Jatrophihabitans sp.]|uniref:DUF305 domain-containing protein n=1 Tax=uncultured Jatrophihabitans sp. TaxID=1610747 RepID=UPI0035C9E59D
MTATLDAPKAAVAPSPPGRLRVMLLAVIAVAVLVIAAGVGWLVRGDGGAGSNAMPTASSVDAGFARDMATHHTQAVTMAGYERDNTTNPALKNLAFDIETSQESQVGEFQGWLDTWGLSRNSPDPMSWMGSSHMAMGSDGLMPGMATPAQMSKLETLHGKALDVFFLQLMIRHHQGGIPMAQYAEEHASEPYVRTVAGHIVAGQSAEIIEMEQLLRQLGSSPLSPPS